MCFCMGGFDGIFEIKLNKYLLSSVLKEMQQCL